MIRQRVKIHGDTYYGLRDKLDKDIFEKFNLWIVHDARDFGLSRRLKKTNRLRFVL